MRPHFSISRGLFLACAFLVTWLAVPDRGEAQQIPSPYSFIDSRHEGSFLVGIATENRGQLELGPGGGTTLGGRYSIKMGAAFGFEATGLLLSTDRRVVDPEAEGGPEFLGTTSSLVGAVDARIRFSPMGHRTWNGLAPYAAAGGGVGMDFRRSSALEEDMSSEARFSFGPSFMGTLGAGLRWLPGERLGFRVESNFHLWKLGTPRPFLDLQEELGSLPDQEWTGLGTILVGASLRF